MQRVNVGRVENLCIGRGHAGKEAVFNHVFAGNVDEDDVGLTGKLSRHL